MGRAESPAATGGRFRPVGFEQPAEPERRVRTDEQIDLDNLSEEEREVVTADEFVVYGKANIEQWNDPGPGEDHLYIEMDALEQSLDQLLALENISFGHQDVRVGEPLKSHTLDSDATVHLDHDETLTLAAGDELRTQVIREGEPLPGNNGTATEDALWLAANIFGRDDPRGSRFSQKVRLGAYYGDLDGFSVTVDKLEMTPTEKGTRAHEVDFLAVTIGDDELIKNPGSSFGVAEFQALFGVAPGGDVTASREAASQAAEGAAPGSPSGRSAARFDAETTLMGSIMNSLFGTARDELAAQALQQAHGDGSTDIETAVSQLAEGNEDEVLDAAREKAEALEAEAEALAAEADDEDMDADEVEDRAADLADELGVDKEVVMAAVDEVRDMQEQMDDEGDDGADADEEPDEDEGGPPDQMGEERVAEIVEEQLDERLPDGDVVTQADVEDALEGVATTDELESQLEGLGESISDDIGDFVEEQMTTGATPGPTGGGVDTTDVKGEIAEMAEKRGLEVDSE